MINLNPLNVYIYIYIWANPKIIFEFIIVEKLEKKQNLPIWHFEFGGNILFDRPYFIFIENFKKLHFMSVSTMDYRRMVEKNIFTKLKLTDWQNLSFSMANSKLFLDLLIYKYIYSKVFFIFYFQSCKFLLALNSTLI